jgi:arylsulfatase A-like enzyme/Flp pilus assembly protein TadD
MKRPKRKGGPRREVRSVPVAASPVNRQRPWRLIIFCSVALITAGLAWWRFRPAYSPPLPRARDNFLLITLDTTRADRLGAYGYAGAKTRHLDRLASEGVRFEHASSPAPITLPAHASIFTGLYPPAHGVRNNGNFYLGERFETLATILGRQGYRTAAFVSSFILDRRYGLARGFELYDDAMQGAQPQVIALEAERRGDRTALVLSQWLERQAAAPGAPFFAWLHLYDPHEPYRPPQPFRDMFKGKAYDGEIAFDDAIVASILDKLGQLGLRERTLIAVIGDHGESLGDHGEETHSMFVYESAIRVPFLLWRPGLVPAGVVVQEPVRAIDLAPTVLDLLGAPPLPHSDGRSLVPVLEGRGKGSPPPVYAETYLPQFYMNWSPLRAIRDERFKLIDAPKPELYDLKSDPAEARNLYMEQPETARALRRGLDAITGGSEGAMSVGALDREAMEKLAALGYVGAGAESAPMDPGQARADPKDVIAVFNRLRRANTAVRDRRFAEALPVVRQVLQDDPKNAFARVVMGSAYMGMDQYPEAIRWFRKYLELVPTSAYAHHWLAVCYLKMGDRDNALREAAAALAIDPRFTDARIIRGGVLAARGDYDGAIAELRTAVTTDPAKPMLRLDLAKVLGEAGHTAEAEGEYRALLGLKPDDPTALIGLGVLQAKTGATEEAARSLRRALELNPAQDGARYDLGQVLEKQGRPDEARAEYRRLIEGRKTPPAVREAARRRLVALGS